MFPLLGVAAGVMAGLLGIGGGLVLIGALVWLLPAHGIPADAVMHTALASSLASIILTGASSARAHNARGSVLWPTVAWMVPGLLLGGWLGSWFAVAVQGEVLRWCVALYCFLVAAQMAFGGPRGGASRDGVVPTGWPMAAAGGGSMTVPLLVWRGVQPVRAVGTSSACGVFIAIASAAGYAVHAPDGALPAHAVGYVYLPAAIGIALASVLAAPLGTRLAHAISGTALKRVFAVFMVLVGISVLAR